MSVRVDIVASGDPKYPLRVRVTIRDERGQLVGVRNIRAVTEVEANATAATFG